MEKNDYSSTLNLPKTDFPMRGNLPEREPAFLRRFEENKAYEKILERNKMTGKTFVLHDGPPYANGDIHMGHSLNKVIKDMIVRYKTITGYYAPYIPGWDTHGLPIEKKVQVEKKIFKDDVGIVKFRQICKDFALEAVERQAKQFKRLGILGDFDKKRYLTLDKDFEADEIGVFWEMYKNGYIYRDLKPVYWCHDCETALAEAEIEYKEDMATSIYVKFRVADDKGLFAKYGDLKDTYMMIWTTTPWTLPGNMAITVGPEIEYSLVEVKLEDKTERYVLAKELVEDVMKQREITEYKELATFKGEEFERIMCEKPLDSEKKSMVILGGDNDVKVELDTGTGLVHTAAGHGHEDYLACKKYEELEIIVPVDSKGVMTKEAGMFEGLKYDEANKKIVEYLEETGALYAKKELAHQYPHCWRCKKPVIYRATTQWFASVKGFRDNVLEEIKKIKWHPYWGEERMTNMVKDRSDWCISRQRVWGVPIPIFYCKNCSKELINENTIERIKMLVRVNGTDMWYDMTEEQILKDYAVCPDCGGKEFKKEMDIMDVWFDSGSTHKAILEHKKYGINQEVADLYLEGNDQYRGWFQSSLLTSVAVKGKAPYKQILTHGMVVDGEGRKMSKSLGNGVDPLKVVEKYGADVLRFWVVSQDCETDARISEDILAQVSEVYKKIRNTIRFLLGNLSDFNINSDIVPYEEREEIDKYMMHKLNKLVEDVTESYETYQFHAIYESVRRFANELSSKYLDIQKDILYTYRKDHKVRRSCQSTMNDILRALVGILAPILPFTAEETWSYMQHKYNNELLSVMIGGYPTVHPEYSDNIALIEKWEKIFEIKEELAKELETKRAEKVIGNSLDAIVTVNVPKEEYEFMKENLEKIKFVSIISGLEVNEAETKSIIVEKSTFAKCPRCWTYSASIGRDARYTDLCEKCIKNM